MARAPSRIDWRWALAAEATQYSDSEARYMLRSADQTTRDAYLYKRAADAGLDCGRWPAIAYAYDTYTARPNLKIGVDGLLLARADNEYIAKEASMEEADVQAYHDLFFDVRARLDSPLWIVEQLFQGSLYDSINPRDKVAKMHRVAWLGGKEVFMAYSTGRKDPVIKAQLGVLTKDMVAKLSLLTAMSVCNSSENGVEVLRLFIDETNAEVANAASGGQKDVGAAVLEFLQSVPLSVADPTDPRNVTLPAREPRALQYLTQAEVADVVPANVR